MSELFAG